MPARSKPTVASASAAATARAIEPGRLTGLSWLPANANAAAATVKPSLKLHTRCGPAFSLSAVCDQMLCRCHAQSAAGITDAVTRPYDCTCSRRSRRNHPLRSALSGGMSRPTAAPGVLVLCAADHSRVRSASASSHCVGGCREARMSSPWHAVGEVTMVLWRVYGRAGRPGGNCLLRVATGRPTAVSCRHSRRGGHR